MWSSSRNGFHFKLLWGSPPLPSASDQLGWLLVCFSVINLPWPGMEDLLKAFINLLWRASAIVLPPNQRNPVEPRKMLFICHLWEDVHGLRWSYNGGLSSVVRWRGFVPALGWSIIEWRWGGGDWRDERGVKLGQIFSALQLTFLIIRMRDLGSFRPLFHWSCGPM